MTKKQKRAGLVAQIGMAIVLVITTGFLILYYWPSSAVSFTDPWVVTNPDHVVGPESELDMSVGFCNEGVNTTAHRFMDLYLDVDEDGHLERAGAFEMTDVLNFSGDLGRNGCFEDVPQQVIIPSFIEDGYYKFRVISEWKVNGFSLRTATVQSEMFQVERRDD